jgi:hypothetical protein
VCKARCVAGHRIQHHSTNLQASAPFLAAMICQLLNPAYRVWRGRKKAVLSWQLAAGASVALRAHAKGSGNKAEQSDRWEG